MEATMKKDLQKLALQIRIGIVEAIKSRGSGHIGGSFSIADALAVLYGSVMKYDPKNPKWADRDKLVCSKGHAGPAVYATLAVKGFFPYEELKTLNQPHTNLPSHCDRNKTVGVDMTTGSLGQGVSAACGMALAAKLDNSARRVWAVMGDGESEEGQVWESAMFASHYKLDNLCYILDWNGLQIDGPIAEVMNPTPYREKFEAFGWNVIEADAHDFESLDSAVKAAKAFKGKPSVIVAKSTKGKGVSFMENQVSWHGAAPNEEQYNIAMAELKA